MDCVIFYELVERSYENDLLIKTELERRGYRAKICNLFWRDFWKCLFWRPKVLLMSGCRDTKQLSQQLPFLFKRDLVIINLQEEQIAFSSDADLDLFMPHGRAKEAYHFSWGSFSDNYMKKANVLPNHVIKIPPIQFDMCRKSWDEYFFSRQEIAEEFHLNIKKKWILFASDFCITSMCNTREQLEKLMNTVSDVYEKVFNAEKQMEELLFSWWDAYLTTHKDAIVIYRPHPSENRKHEFIEQLMSKHENFVYIRDYSIKQWIHVIDIYTTWISTSIMEAYYGEIPCFALGISSTIVENGIAIPLFDYSKYISDYMQFQTVMDEPEAYKDGFFPINFEMATYYYGQATEKMAYIEICNYIEKILINDELQKEMKLRLTKTEREIEKKERGHYLWITFYNDLFCLLKPLLWYVIPNKRDSILKFESDLKRFDKKVLRQKEQRIRKLLMQQNFENE